MNYLFSSRYRFTLSLVVFFACTAISPVAASTLTGNEATNTKIQELQLLLDKLQTQLTQLGSAPASATVVSTTLSSATSSPFDIVIVAGQSNSVGYGKGTYTEDPQYATPQNTAKVFQVGRFLDHDMKIIPVIHDPMEFWEATNTYAAPIANMRGASYPFALRLAATETTGRNVLIIPAAYQGTSILRWDNVINDFGTTTAPDSTVLYDDMMKRVKFALAQNPQNRVVAVIWRQGEADVRAVTQRTSSYSPFMTTAIYKTKLRALRDRMRQDLSSQGCVPFLFGEMTQQWLAGVPRKDAITNAIKDVATQDTCKKSVFVSSASTTVNDNGNGSNHFDAKGQFEMAKRMWAAYQTLASSTPVISCITTTSLATGTSFVAKTAFQFRTGPAYSYKVFPTWVATSTTGTITDGPVLSVGEKWFKVNYSTGISGWSREAIIMQHATSILYPKVCQ